MVKFRFLEMIDLKDFYEKGYAVAECVLPLDEINLFKKRIDEVFKLQKKEFDEDFLSKIGEEGIVRFPFLYDPIFLSLFTRKDILSIVQLILGEHCILSLQNSIIVSPKKLHHQSFFHRDVIHQDFTSSKPIGVNVYYCLDEYSEHNGGTCFILGSHKMEKLPKKIEETIPRIKAGSVLFFDSMIYHKAGQNKSDSYRYGINHMFVLPFMKQQIDVPFFLGDDYSADDTTLRLLGYFSKEYKSVIDFRKSRYKKIIR